MRLRSVVFPEPLRHRRTVQVPAGSVNCSTSSTSRFVRSSSGNDFFTSRTKTADRGLMAMPEGSQGLQAHFRSALTHYRIAMGLTGTPIPPCNRSGPTTKRNSYARSLANSSRLRISMM